VVQGIYSVEIKVSIFVVGGNVGRCGVVRCLDLWSHDRLNGWMDGVQGYSEMLPAVTERERVAIRDVRYKVEWI